MSVALFFFGLTSVYTMPKPWVVRNARYAPTFPRAHFFSAASQFRVTAIGAETWASRAETTRNVPSSRVSSY